VLATKFCCLLDATLCSLA